MYLQINEELYKNIKEITNGDYDRVGDMIPAKNIIAIIEDLMDSYYVLEEKYEDLKQDMESNYKPMSIQEQVDISDRDFI